MIKKDEIDTIFLIEYHVLLLDNLDHTALIEKWEKNIDATAYE